MGGVIRIIFIVRTWNNTNIIIIKICSSFQIDSDFVELFGNPDKLFNNWEFFSQHFLDYVRTNDIKDDFSRRLLTTLDDSAIGQGMKLLLQRTRN